MLLARVGSGVYDTLLILHILSVIVAFAPAIVHPLTGTRLLRQDEGAARRFFSVSAANGRAVYLPALGLVGLLGFALVGASGKTYEFKDPWVGIAIVLWVAIAGMVSAVILPAERGSATGEAGAAKKLQLGGSIATVLLIVVVILMVVKPGG